MPGPSSSTVSRTCPSTRSTDARTWVPGGVWRIAFSTRFSVRRCSSSRAPSTYGAVGVDRQLVAVGDDAELAGRLDEHLADVGRRVRRLARGVVAGQQQQVGDEPAHAPRRAQRRVRGLLLLAVEALGQQLEVGEHARQRRAQLVRGVGDELALAAQRVLGLAARGVERVEHAVQRARELGDLVVGLDGGDLLGGVARALDLARGRRQRRDRRHRAAGDHEPGEQRQPGAAEHADDEKQAQAPDGRVDGGQRARVLQVERDEDDLVAGARDLARLDEVAVLLGALDESRPSRGAGRSPSCAPCCRAARRRAGRSARSSRRRRSRPAAGRGRRARSCRARLPETSAVVLDPRLQRGRPASRDLALEVLVQALRVRPPTAPAKPHRITSVSSAEPPASRQRIGICLGAENVACAADRMEETRLIAGFQLPSQVRYEDLDGVRRGKRIVAPHLFQ